MATSLINNRRADLMIDLVHAFALVIGDYLLVNANASSWTRSHPHLINVKSVVSCLVHIIVDEYHASHILDLGSYHRAILAEMHLQKRRK